MKIVGISGPSCSGKSTLARHLRQVLPHAVLSYEDDFYKPESELPLDSEGRPNWDVPESFDFVAMRQVLSEIKASNTLPPYKVTREDKNNLTDSLLTHEETTELCKILSRLQGDEPVLLVDGILLFHDSSPVEDLFDLKILMPFEYDELKRRRDGREGYATADNGFWVDPPNFFEDIVWPEFVAHCGFLYNGQDFQNLSSEARSRSIVLAPMVKSMHDTIIRVGELIAKA